MDDGFEGKFRKLFGLGCFWVIAAIVATFLPTSWSGPIGLIVLALVLGGFGSIAISLVFGGDGFDYWGRGFVLALFGYLLVKYVFGWELVSPYAALTDVLAPSPPERTPQTASLGTWIAAVFIPMAMDFGMVAVGMVIVAIPTLPIIFLKNSKV